MVDRFANGDPGNDGTVDPADPNAFHGGDLAGVIAHLDDIQATGADTVWLSPIFRMRTEPFFGFGAFHGYWTEDIGEIEPRFGDENTLRALSDALHTRGMKLYLDVVYNHVAPDGALFARRPDWFHPPRPIQHWDDPVEVVEGQVHGLPDLAQENPEVYGYLRDASLRWMPLADGFRVDAVRHMPVSFLGRLAGDLRAVDPDFRLLGEVFDGDPAKVADAVTGGGLDAVFDFPLHFAMLDVFCKGQPPGALGAILAQDDRYPAGTELVTFLDNHDRPRIRTSCGDAEATALDFLFAVRGTPSLTWGTEVGLTGEREPENRGDMVFGETALRREIASRMAARRASPALERGDTRPLYLDDSLFVFARVAPGDSRWVAVNTGASRAWRGRTIPTGVSVFAAPPPGIRAPRPVHLSGTAPLGPGDELRLVGAGSSFGSWDPGKGVVLPARVTLEHEVQAFKLVIAHPDGTFTWEPGGNRYLLPEGGRVAFRWP